MGSKESTLHLGLSSHYVQTNSFGLYLIVSWEKVPGKLGEENSVWSDGLSTGCPGQWAAVRRENEIMQEFFCTTLYKLIVMRL